MTAVAVGSATKLVAGTFAIIKNTDESNHTLDDAGAELLDLGGVRERNGQQGKQEHGQSGLGAGTP